MEGSSKGRLEGVPRDDFPNLLENHVPKASTVLNTVN